MSRVKVTLYLHSFCVYCLYLETSYPTRRVRSIWITEVVRNNTKVKHMQEKAKIQQIPIKVYRTTDRLMIATPMAGMQPEDILVQISPDSRLLIHGEVLAMRKDIKEL